MRTRGTRTSHSLRRKFLTGLVVAMCHHAHALGADVAAPSPPVDGVDARDNYWSIGLAGYQNNLKSGTDQSLLGPSLVVQVGRGHLENNWFLSGTLDIISGPYRAQQGGPVDLDFQGTGFTALLGYSAENTSLRTDLGNYGFTFGISYSDMVGRSLEGKRTQLADGNAIEKFTTRVTNFSILPAVFFCWLEPPRKKGNDPDLLVTRIEGYILNLGIAVPMKANFTNKYDKISEDGVTPQSERGSLKGYTLMVSLTAALGV